MNEADDIFSALPPEDDESKSLRREIVDELTDHFACAMEREGPGSPDKETAWANVIQKFGDPRAVALQLWRIAMAERVAKERFMIAAISMLIVSQVLFIGAFYYWIAPKLTAADDLRASNEEILLAVQELRQSVEGSGFASQATPSGMQGERQRAHSQPLPPEIKASVTHELPVTKDCMVLKYLPDWNYGNVDNIAVANNEGGVRTLVGWGKVGKELVDDPTNKYMLALYARKVTFQSDDSQMGVFRISGEWPELTSWNQFPAIDSDPVDTMKVDQQEGWKLFDVTEIVRGNAEQQGVCIRFLDESKTGSPSTWSGFAFVSREGTGEWEGLGSKLLVMNSGNKTSEASTATGGRDL